MRGCAKGKRMPKKPGRGCTVHVKPGKKHFRHHDPFKMMIPVFKGLRLLTRR